MNQKNSNVTQHQQYRDFLSFKYSTTWLAIAGIYTLAFLPSFMQKMIAWGLGQAAYYLISSRRKVTLINLSLCFKDKSPTQIRKLAKKTFVANIFGFIETCIVWCRAPKSYAKNVSVTGAEHIHAALEKGQGVLLVGGHFAMLDLGGALLGQHAPINVVYRKHDNPLFNFFMTKSREKFVKKTIARKDIRGLLKSLRKGEVIWYAPDQDYGRKDSVFVPFFGVPTATITSTTRLAQLGNAKVLSSVYYHKNGQRIVEVRDDLQAIPSTPENDALLTNQWLESKIEQYPHEYMWLHKRFKTRPKGEPSFYKK